jgi:hypothetical protein
MTTSMQVSSNHFELESNASLPIETEFTLSPSLERNIDILCQVAEMNGDKLYVSDLGQLLPIEAELDEFEHAILRSVFLSSKYAIVDGLLTAKKTGSLPVGYLDKAKRAKMLLAMEHIEYGRRFAAFFIRDNNVKMIAVSGSTSYLSVSKSDDLDFFCITGDNSLWIFITQALLLGRFIRLIDRATPALCFSYVLGESRVKENFRTQRDGLLARDTLATKVLKGTQYYRSLLGQNRWLSVFFPRIYETKLSEDSEESVWKKNASSRMEGGLTRVLNLLLYHTVGNYIKLKSRLLNSKLRSKGRGRSFTALIEKDKHVFESDYYTELRRVYANYSKRRISD